MVMAKTQTPWLINATEDPRCHPPGDWALSELKPGDQVRVVAAYHDAEGRMQRDPVWVRITRIVTTRPGGVEHPAGIPLTLAGVPISGGYHAGLRPRGTLLFHRDNIIELA